MSKDRSTQAVATGFGHYVRELQAIGLNDKDSYKLGNLINRWMKSRGPNGCLDFMDSLGECIKSYLYGLPRPQTKCWLTVDKDGFPTRLRFVKAKLSRTSMKRLSVFKRLIRIKRPTKLQIKKFVDAVTGSPAESSAVDGVLNAFVRPGIRHFRRSSKERYVRSGSYLGLYPIKAIGARKEGQTSSHLQKAARNLFSDLLHLEPLWENHTVQEFYTTAIKDAVYESWVPNKIHDFVDMVRAGNSTFDQCHANEFVGNIGLMQEPGGKLRCFASPRVVYQVMLTPLFTFLSSLLSQMEQDCTGDQAKGAVYALEQIRLGRTIHSVDLSNATDRFPYSLQRRMLKEFNVPESLIQVVDFVVKGQWRAPKSMGGRISWSQGQPLGLLPSFAMFALTHHFLIRGIYLKLGIEEFSYRILGDDVIICNDRVAEVYKKLLPQLGVSISTQKSYTSDRYAEFAGFQSDAEETFRPGKFREVTKSNLIDKLNQAKNPFAYLSANLIEPELLKVAYPYGLKPPEDEDLERYPLETLQIIYNDLKVVPKEFILALEIRGMFQRFFLRHRGGSHEDSFMHVYQKVQHIEGINLDYEYQDIINGPIGLCRDKLNEIIQGILYCQSKEHFMKVKVQLNLLFSECKLEWGRLQTARFVSSLYPSFDAGREQVFDKRINQLARINGMEFSVSQLNRLLQKAAFSKELPKFPKQF